MALHGHYHKGLTFHGQVVKPKSLYTHIILTTNLQQLPTLRIIRLP